MSLHGSKMSSRCSSTRKQGECESQAMAEVGGGGSTGRSAKGIFSWIIQVFPTMASAVGVASRLVLG
jgi:hypothetical protein